MTHDMKAKHRHLPWLCSECGKREVYPTKTPYTAEVKHDGRLYELRIPQIEIPTCRACGDKVFTNRVDEQISDALRVHLHLLTPDQIREAIGQATLNVQL